MVNVAILGYGIVGSGVAEVINKNASSIASRAGQEIKVKKILDVRDFPDSPDNDVLTKNADEVFNDPSIQIVVETIGGANIAHEFTKKALEMGKHVVTSNKELVAAHGPELLKLAGERNLSYLFEASVGGGIPIIRPLNQCLAANEINGITGILNGTTNYILTQMRKGGKDFAEALKEAQQKGYAEANPTADVEGHDACRKIAILSSIAYNEFVDYRSIYTEGIAKITLADMEYANEMDSVIKLIAMSRRVENGIVARVSPAIISRNHPLGGVEDVFNAIVVSGDAIGDAMFYGRGAGKLPTASAVVADIIDIARDEGAKSRNLWHRTEIKNVLDIDDNEVAFFVRLSAENSDMAKKAVVEVFGDVEFIELHKPAYRSEVAFRTAKARERVLKAGLESLKAHASSYSLLNVIRIQED